MDTTDTTIYWKSDDGFRFAKSYRLGKTIGWGNYCRIRHGERWRMHNRPPDASDQIMKQPVALKCVVKEQCRRLRVPIFLPNGEADTESALTRFRNEVEIQFRMNHPNIAHAYEWIEDCEHGLEFLAMDMAPCVTMEFDSRNLRYRIPPETVKWIPGECEEPRQPCALVYNEVGGRWLFRQLLGGVRYLAARGVVHKDIKPDNLVMTRPIPPGFVRALDVPLKTPSDEERHRWVAGEELDEDEDDDYLWSDAPTFSLRQGLGYFSSCNGNSDDPDISSLESQHFMPFHRRDRIFPYVDDALKIIDFSVAVQLPCGETKIWDAEGTRCFTPPERLGAEGGPTCGVARDIWSMGVTLYVWTFGSLPFWSENPIALILSITSETAPTVPKEPPISPELEDLIRRMLEKDPNRRATLAEIAAHPWTRGGVARR